MPIIETEIWKLNPDRPGTVIFDSQRIAQDIYNELEAHLKADGRLPDEYFLLGMAWRDKALFPKDADILCDVNFGGSEGIYLDISVKYKKDVYERSQETGEWGWINRPVIEAFATGKTLGDTIDDLDRMNLVAASVTAAFYGGKIEVQERYAKIESGEIAPVYLSADHRADEVCKPDDKVIQPPTLNPINPSLQDKLHAAGDRVKKHCSPNKSAKARVQKQANSAR
jgi:hypothetical protein